MYFWVFIIAPSTLHFLNDKMSVFDIINIIYDKRFYYHNKIVSYLEIYGNWNSNWKIYCRKSRKISNKVLHLRVSKFNNVSCIYEWFKVR